jgi:hypothetical protein
MGFRGRLEAIKAPTIGKARKGTKTKKPLALRSAPQLSGTCADRASNNSGTLATNIATQREASDQASQAAARGLIPPTPLSRSPDPSATAPLYSTVPPPGVTITYARGFE